MPIDRSEMLGTGPLNKLCRSSSFLPAVPAVGSLNLVCPQVQRMALITTCQVLGEPIQVHYSVFIRTTQKLVLQKQGDVLCVSLLNLCREKYCQNYITKIRK